MLGFQLRWLDQDVKEPVIWGMKLQVKPGGNGQVRKWEEYQSMVFGRLEPQSQALERVGRIKLRAPIAGISFGGSYIQVPLAELGNEEDVATRLIKPSLEL